MLIHRKVQSPLMLKSPSRISRLQGIVGSHHKDVRYSGYMEQGKLAR